jgi:hypothetical protein
MRTSLLVGIQQKQEINHIKQNILEPSDKSDILESLGLQEYLDTLNPQIVSRRLKLGMIGKRSKGGIKYFQPRLFLIISAKSLYPKDTDEVILSDSQLPPWMTVDTLYYYEIEKIDDSYRLSK